MSGKFPEPSGQRILDLEVADELLDLLRLFSVPEVTGVLSVNDGRYIAKYGGVHYGCENDESPKNI